MNRILHVRQFFSDMLSAADLWLVSGGVAVALLLPGCCKRERRRRVDGSRSNAKYFPA